MSMGVTIIRGTSKKIADESLAKILANNKVCMSLAVPHSSGSHVQFRKNVHEFKLEDVQQAINHANVIGKKIGIFLGSSPDIREDADVQPYPVLFNAEGKPTVVAFMNGDFSQFAQEGQTKSPELLCLEKKIIPLVTKAFKIGDQDIAKTMDELADDVYTDSFVNLMVGPNGCITLMGANGVTQTYLVNGDSESYESEDSAWWASNAYLEKVSESPEAPAKDPDDELGDVMSPATAPVPGPTPKIMPTQVKKPGHGLPGSKPTAAPAAPADQPVDRTAESNPLTALDLTDPTAKLTLKVPPGMDNKRLGKWLAGIMPEGMVPKTFHGLKEVSVMRKDANAKFLQTYINQNKLAGLDALKGSTAVQAPKRLPTPVVQATAPAEQPKTGDSPTPAVQEPKKEPDVTTEPLPVFSPASVLKVVNFNKAVDAKGNKIASPEEMEKKIGTFFKMFGDKFAIPNLRSWLAEDCQEFCRTEPKLAGNLLYWVTHEYTKASDMLDALTDPHTKKTEKTVEQPQQPAVQPKVAAAGGRRMPSMIR